MISEKHRHLNFINYSVFFSSLSTWVSNCENMEMPEEKKEELDSFIDQLYEDIEKGEVSLWQISPSFSNTVSVFVHVSIGSPVDHMVLKQIKSIIIIKQFWFRNLIFKLFFQVLTMCVFI